MKIYRKANDIYQTLALNFASPYVEIELTDVEMDIINFANKINAENQTDENICDFINRRFSQDCNWTTGNCYYFAVILHSRFQTGTIFYDVINGHFIYYYKGRYYDWTGEIVPENTLVEWNKFDKYDSTLKQRIIEDCIL